uniref:Uncharacterized protein n=1 Tax=Physcomitrium patens TaxID=3218 RepID=A9SZD9_PHYPA|nr:hypothetical protein PHYPA_013828 [Physcomitrium patens]
MAYYDYDDDMNSEYLGRDEELPAAAIIRHYYAPNIYTSEDKIKDLFRKLHHAFSVDSVHRHSNWNNYITVTGYEPEFDATKVLRKMKRMDSQASKDGCFKASTTQHICTRSLWLLGHSSATASQHSVSSNCRSQEINMDRSVRGLAIVFYLSPGQNAKQFPFKSLVHIGVPRGLVTNYTKEKKNIHVQVLLGHVLNKRKKITKAETKESAQIQFDSVEHMLII